MLLSSFSWITADAQIAQLATNISFLYQTVTNSFCSCCQSLPSLPPSCSSSQTRIWHAHWWCHGSQGRSNFFFFGSPENWLFRFFPLLSEHASWFETGFWNQNQHGALSVWNPCIVCVIQAACRHSGCVGIRLTVDIQSTVVINQLFDGLLNIMWSTEAVHKNTCTWQLWYLQWSSLCTVLVNYWLKKDFLERNRNSSQSTVITVIQFYRSTLVFFLVLSQGLTLGGCLLS